MATTSSSSSSSSSSSTTSLTSSESLSRKVSALRKESLESICQSEKWISQPNAVPVVSFINGHNDDFLEAFKTLSVSMPGKNVNREAPDTPESQAKKSSQGDDDEKKRENTEERLHYVSSRQRNHILVYQNPNDENELIIPTVFSTGAAASEDDARVHHGAISTVLDTALTMIVAEQIGYSFTRQLTVKNFHDIPINRALLVSSMIIKKSEDGRKAWTIAKVYTDASKSKVLATANAFFIRFGEKDVQNEEQLKLRKLLGELTVKRTIQDANSELPVYLKSMVKENAVQALREKSTFLDSHPLLSQPLTLPKCDNIAAENPDLGKNSDEVKLRKFDIPDPEIVNKNGSLISAVGGGAVAIEMRRLKTDFTNPNDPSSLIGVVYFSKSAHGPPERVHGGATATALGDLALKVAEIGKYGLPHQFTIRDITIELYNGIALDSIAIGMNFTIDSNIEVESENKTSANQNFIHISCDLGSTDSFENVYLKREPLDAKKHLLASAKVLIAIDENRPRLSLL